MISAGIGTYNHMHVLTHRDTHTNIIVGFIYLMNGSLFLESPGCTFFLKVILYYSLLKDIATMQTQYRGQRTTCRNSFSPFTTQVLGIELRSPDLTASAFIQ